MNSILRDFFTLCNNRVRNAFFQPCKDIIQHKVTDEQVDVRVYVRCDVMGCTDKEQPVLPVF